MIMTSFTTFLFAILSLFALALGAPMVLDTRDVFVPPVTYPHTGTVWKIGNHHNVTWDTSKAPKQITNTKGKVLLAHEGVQDVDHPLAQGFNILDGHVVIQVPKVSPGNKYAVVLFGDSGNYSPDFTISSA